MRKLIIICLMLISLVSFSQVETVSLSELTNKDTIEGTDKLYIEDASNYSYYTTISRMRSYMVTEMVMKFDNMTIDTNAYGQLQSKIFEVSGDTARTKDEIEVVVINGKLYIPSLDSSSTYYQLYYDKDSGLITYDSTSSGTAGTNFWSETGDDIENNNAGDVILNNQVYVPDIAPSGNKYSGNVAGIGFDNRLFPKSIIDLYNEQQDTLSKLVTPSVYAQWKRDTANGELYPATLTDKVGIGTDAPTDALDVRGGIRLGKRSSGCSIVFTDDDGQVESYTETLPLMDKYSVPACLAINAERHSATPSTYLSWSQMGTLQNDYGWEVINHSWNHENLNTIYDSYGADSVRDCVQKGRDSLIAHGMVVNNFCYPFSSEKPEVRAIIRELHRAAIGRDYDYADDYLDNYVRFPLETYRMSRFDFDAVDWDAGSYGSQYEVDSSKSYFYYKTIIDTAYKYGYNIQFMMHSRFLANDSVAVYDKDSTLSNFWTVADQILSYIVDTLEIPVLTLNQFLDRSGNLIDIGDPDPDSNYFAVSADGQIARTKIISGNTIVGNFAGRYFDATINQTLYGWMAGDSVVITNKDDALFRNITAFGFQSGYHNTRGGFTAVGYQAGYANTGSIVTAVGNNAGNHNTGAQFTGTGYQAGYHNTGDGVTVMGTLAGVNNTGAGLTAFGYNAAGSNTKASVCAFGNYALNGNTGTGPLSAFGHWAGRGNTGHYLHAFGYYAGRNNTGANLTAFGYQAGYGNTGANSIMLGYFAGYTNTTASRFIVAQTIVNATPLLIGDLANNKLGIGKAPAYNLDVAGSGSISTYLITGTGSIANNDSTPSVAAGNTFIYAGSANSVSIDALDDHVVGAYYTIFGNSDTYTITIPDGSVAGGDSFNLSATWVGGPDDCITLYCKSADTFKEVSRSDN